LIDDSQGRTLASASTAEASINDVESLGKEIAGRAKANNIEKAVFDRGSLAYGGNLAKLADAARSGGLDF
jgi:large subunit ribosomal protein L18